MIDSGLGSLSRTPEARPDPPKAVNWGIISTARINRKFLAGAREAAAVSVLAVGSRSAHAADRYAHEQAIPRAYGSYDALLADRDVEAVYISLPNSLHVEWAIRALRAGKHVLCEKPLSRYPGEVERAYDVAEREGRFLMEAFMFRHNPQTVKLVELVREGAIGTVRIIRGAFSFSIADPQNVRLSAGLGGGALMDVGCYCVSAARLLAGEPISVSGQQVLGGDGVDVAFVGTMAFAEGALAHFDAGLQMTGRHELEVVGDAGALYLDDPWHCVRPGITLRGDGGVQRIDIEPINSYRLEAENLSHAIRGDGAPLLGGQDALGQARAIEALYDAAAGSRVVTLG